MSTTIKGIDLKITLENSQGQSVQNQCPPNDQPSQVHPQPVYNIDQNPQGPQQPHAAYTNTPSTNVPYPNGHPNGASPPYYQNNQQQQPQQQAHIPPQAPQVAYSNNPPPHADESPLKAILRRLVEQRSNRK